MVEAVCDKHQLQFEPCIECENGRLRAELAAERKKCEEAEAGLAEFTVMQQCLRESEAQVEVLREGIGTVGNEFDRLHIDVPSRYVAERIFSLLDNLPARAEKVKAVLEAADEFEKEGEPCCEAGVELNNRVREWREK